ncbi:MAG: histidine kinase N-terminal domain-containing protein [Coriobacteriia bacterium]|nr:histidine kinase N-terminal domain-containing protein [Coriobacteriia bacterium]
MGTVKPPAVHCRILALMGTGASSHEAVEPGRQGHLDNVAGNLQLIADMGYGDVALAERAPDGALHVIADARPMTAVAAVAHSRTGRTLSAHDEPEAYRALREGTPVAGERRRTTRGISYVTHAYPIGPPGALYGVLIRDLTQLVVEAPGKMEVAFMGIAEDLISLLAAGPLLSVAEDAPFVTTRRAGDGVMRLDTAGRVLYGSPNAVNILKNAGLEGGLVGTSAAELPGGTVGIGPVLGAEGAHAAEVEVGGRVLWYRAIGVSNGYAVFVEDFTEARLREQELKVKEATIREVHHRVKNNLQTIASLLRIQARRSGSPEASRALAEAVERVSSMAVVHEMLSVSTDETVDFGEAARTVVDMVRQGIAGTKSAITVEVEGTVGNVPASTGTSLALVTAELVHNAIEHGLGAGGHGAVVMSMRRLPSELHLVVRDDGVGLPDGFDVTADANLGLAIVRTIVEDDLRGTLTFGGGRGTTVTIRVPVPPDPPSRPERPGVSD